MQGILGGGTKKSFSGPKFPPRRTWARADTSGRKKQNKDIVFGQGIPGQSGTQTSGYPGRKLYATSLFL